MATQPNTSHTLESQMAALGITPDDLAKIAADKAKAAKPAPTPAGTRREVSTGKPVVDNSTDALLARIAELENKLETGKGNAGKITMHVTEKGALAIYGLGRFPTTLYATQWRRIIEAIPDLETFIERHSEVPEVYESKGVRVSRLLKTSRD